MLKVRNASATLMQQIMIVLVAIGIVSFGIATEVKAQENGFEKQTTQVISPAKLYQNNPNPFSESTEIRYYIPENTTNAVICIYDMVGGQIMKIENLSRGYSSVTLNGSQLRAGMYMYSLLVDGREIDTKRMILTDK